MNGALLCIESCLFYFAELNLHDVHEHEHAVMNDIDEKLHLEQQESSISNVDDGEADANASDHENSAMATPFDIGFMDPEERALFDMLESEGQATNESILSKDFLAFPSISTASRLSQIPRRTRAAPPRPNSDFLRVFLEDESIGSNEDDSTTSLLDMIEGGDRPIEHRGSSIEHLVKRAVAG